ncbi:MAG: NAD(P)H-binding protein [Melioribacter sp.]|uniref:NmrA family NAD(P)-binding protein n=1 Tax=Rosettibacter primus TaxID=3111523 RepID=UPI00247D2F6F|nr:NAD(P)H-binding protein [Melioribacter sp.]
MTILVTSAIGGVGNRFVPRLLQQGETIRAFFRDPAHAKSIDRLGADLVASDLSDTGSLGNPWTASLKKKLVTK